ncbi:hypothetical protein NA78x_000163 [Anatilimnocola sp. NA78]|uniref:hypothetical protein n=1 Tax=Anatilimnocola sp. NA78 TaxID=3415683 RepID=UPI003CE4904B
MQVRSCFHGATLPAAFLAAATLLIAGCGQGDYDSRVSEVGQHLKTRSKKAADGQLTKDYLSVMDIARTPQGVKFRLPTVFATAQSLNADAPGAKVAHVDIPGFCYTLQVMLADDSGKQIPAYCYLYSAKKATHPPDKLRELIQQASVAIDPNSKWFEASNEPGQPSGQYLLKVGGNHDFLVNGTVEKLPGHLFLSTYETAENIVIIGWRYELNSMKKANLSDAISASVDSALLDVPGAAAPAPGGPAPAAAPMPMPGVAPMPMPPGGPPGPVVP